MEIKLTVRAEIIAVLKLFAADKDIRNCLNGINLEIGRRESRFVATNGVVLGCFRIESEQPEVGAPLTNIIIPNDLLKPIKPSSGLVEITIGDPDKDDGGGKDGPVSNIRPVTLTLAYDGLSLSGKTLDGAFPDYRKVIPSKVSGQPAQFDPRLIGILGKAWSILHGSKRNYYARLGLNGEAAALVSLGTEDFVGVIAPMRVDAADIPDAPPSWVYDDLQAVDEPAADLV